MTSEQNKTNKNRGYKTVLYEMLPTLVPATEITILAITIASRVSEASPARHRRTHVPKQKLQGSVPLPGDRTQDFMAVGGGLYPVGHLTSLSPLQNGNNSWLVKLKLIEK